jgi:hypothetical protein
VLAYERGDFDAHPARTLDLLACAHAYRNALDWAQQTARHMT